MILTPLINGRGVRFLSIIWNLVMGNGLQIMGGTFNFYGVQDIDQLYDELSKVDMRRA